MRSRNNLTVTTENCTLQTKLVQKRVELPWPTIEGTKLIPNSYFENTAGWRFLQKHPAVQR